MTLSLANSMIAPLGEQRGFNAAADVKLLQDVVNRGREHTVSFSADQAGHYKLICTTHGPTMTADILSTG